MVISEYYSIVVMPEIETPYPHHPGISNKPISSYRPGHLGNQDSFKKSSGRDGETNLFCHALHPVKKIVLFQRGGRGSDHSLSGLGFPILNDRYYLNLLSKKKITFSDPLQLLARKIQFTDPVSLKSVSYESERHLVEV